METAYYSNGTGVLSWLDSRDHKRVAVVYLCAVLLFAVIGGALGVLLHLAHWTPEGLLGGLSYNRTFTLHGLVMLFVVLLPGIYVPFGMFLLPLMLGAENFVFPRLNSAGLYLYLLGGGMVLAGSVVGGLDAGFMLYSPFSTGEGEGEAAVMLGAFIVGASLLVISVNFAATFYKYGESMRRNGHVPHFVWGVCATALLHLIAGPWLCFSVPAVTRDTYPEVYLSIIVPYLKLLPLLAVLPPLAVMFEVLSVHARVHVFRYPGVACCLLGLPALVWAAEEVPAGMQVVLVVFVISASLYLLGFWLRVLYRGDVQHNVAGWYAALTLLFSEAGFLWGVADVLYSDVKYLHDTSFVTGKFHYVLMIPGLLAFLAALHHWWPKFTGRLVRERAAKIGAFAVFSGMTVMCLTEALLGLNGMPTRYSAHIPEFQTLHRIAAAGALVLGLGVVWALGCLLASLRFDRRADANPWGGRTLEWVAASPPVTRNFSEPPRGAGGPYDFPRYD